jgi:hypothetical protein
MRRRARERATNDSNSGGIRMKIQQPIGAQIDGAGHVTHLHQAELARRWCISGRTLERWRWLGQGPRYLKLGGRVVYRLADIEAYEAERTRESTAANALPATRTAR